MIFKYFKIEEFACHCGCGQNLISYDFVKRLDNLRERCGFSIVVNSGYRCPSYNSKVSTTGDKGPHTTGRASDLRVDHTKAYLVLKNALELGFTGVGVAQKGGDRYLHLDDLPNSEGQPRPTVWSY